MKFKAIATLFLISIFSVKAAAAETLDCYEVIEGFVQISPSESNTCPLSAENGDRFEINFLFNDVGNTSEFPTCFSGDLTATIAIDGKDFVIEGSSESALTDGFLAGTFPNAASAIKIKDPKLLKGKIFTLDTIGLNGELLEVVSGNRVFKDIEPYDAATWSGSFLEIGGNALEGAAFSGWICLE